MEPLKLIFLLAGAVTLLSALMVVTTRKLVHAALWLVLTLAGVSVLFVLLNAAFLAIVQVVIYIGAIAILIIFAVMLTRGSMDDTGPQTNRRWWLAGLIAVGLFAGILLLVVSEPAASAGVPAEAPGDSLRQLGLALVSVDGYVLPFELASVLLLAALIGAIFVARPPDAASEGGEE
ncbi:MAG: NADH-quinone oxidoreductase subunit J [Anaerolineales bacterium]|nr:NADH-quinone oxidoreductase subunit J [Anaerolineales bacterium]